MRKIGGGAHVEAFHLGVAIEEGGHLLTAEGVVWTEGAVAIACGEAVVSGPGDRVGVPAAGGNVGKVSAAADGWFAFHAVEDAGDHGAAESGIWREGIIRGAGHETLAINIVHGWVEPVVGTDVNEWQHRWLIRIVRRVGRFFEGGCDADGAGRHGKAVGAVAVVRDIDGITAAIEDGDAVDGVTFIRGDGDGDALTGAGVAVGLVEDDLAMVAVGNADGVVMAAARWWLHRGGGAVVGRGEAVDGEGAADFAGSEQERVAGGALSGRHKLQPFRRIVVLDVFAEIAAVDIVDILYLGWIGDVVDHHARGAFEGDKGVGLAIDGAGGDALRLWAFLAGTVVDGNVIVGAVEMVRDICGSQALKVIGAVVHRLHPILRDLEQGEGTAAEEIVLAGIQAVIVVRVEVDDLASDLIFLDIAGWGRFALALLHFVEVAVPVAAVAFVGSEEVGLAVCFIEADAVRHADAEEARVGLWRVCFVFFIDVDGDLAMVFEACAVDVGEGLTVEIKGGDGVGFLEGDVSGIVGGSDVFWFKVGRRVSVLLDDDAVGGEAVAAIIVIREADLRGGIFRGAVRHIDDAHRARWVGGAIAIAFARLAFIGGEDLRAIRGEGDHVRLHAGLNGLLESEGAILGAGEEGHVASLVIVLRLQGGNEGLAIRRDGDGRHIAIGEIRDLAFNEVFHVDLLASECLHTLARFQVLQGNDVKGALEAVDHVGTVVGVVVDDDLGAAAVGAHGSGVIAADLGEIKGGLAILVAGVLFVGGGDGLIRWLARLFFFPTAGGVAAVVWRVRVAYGLAVVDGFEIGLIIVGVLEVDAADGFLLGLDVAVCRFIRRWDLHIFSVIALDGGQVDDLVLRFQARASTRVADVACDGLRVKRVRAVLDQRHSEALVVELDVPFIIARRHLVIRLRWLRDRAATDQVIAARLDRAFEGVGLPGGVVIAIDAGAVLDRPAVHVHVARGRVVELDKAMAGCAIVRAAVDLVDDYMVRRPGGRVIVRGQRRCRLRQHGRGQDKGRQSSAVSFHDCPPSL